MNCNLIAKFIGGDHIDQYAKGLRLITHLERGNMGSKHRIHSRNINFGPLPPHIRFSTDTNIIIIFAELFNGGFGGLV